MPQIKAVAYLNELTKEITNDYYLVPQINGTLYEEDIIKRLEAKEIATKNVNGLAFVRLFLAECLLALSEGYNVVTGLFQASIGIRGSVLSNDLGHNVPAEKVSTRINLIQSLSARETVQDITISVSEQPAPTGPVIQTVHIPPAGEYDVLKRGEMVLIQGMRLAIRGDKTDEIGIYFISEDGKTTVRVPDARVSPNTPTKLQFVLPAEVTPGLWKIKVGTQATTTTATYTKDVRYFEYTALVQVE